MALANGLSMDESRMLDPRWKFISDLIDLNNQKGLEIGALTSPVVQNKDINGGGKVFYLDHLSSEELKLKYKSDKSINVDDIVSVDYVCSDGDLLQVLDKNNFDYVIGSHIIEHVPNMIKFLSDVFEVLRPGGICFLVIPDKRFTFDYKRPLTTFGELLEAYFSGRKRPGIAAVYDHFSTAINVDTNDVWTGKFDVTKSENLVPNSFAWKAANRVRTGDAYLDVHVNIFTPANFFDILNNIVSFELVELAVEKFADTEIGKLEFMVALRKPVGVAQSANKEMCLASIPKMEFESFMSPFMPQVKALSAALDKTTEVAYGLQQELEKLRDTIERQKEERDIILEQLSIAQKVLDRKSVKLVTGLLHKTFGFFR